jgi:hypothetical protein
MKIKKEQLEKLETKRVTLGINVNYTKLGTVMDEKVGDLKK